jgi:hypothetical protein
MSSYVSESEMDKWLIEQRSTILTRNGQAALPDFNTTCVVAPLSELEKDLHTVSYNGARYTRLDDSSKANKEICIAAIANKPSIYLKMPDIQKADREIAFEAIKRQGCLLNSMSEEFQNDRSFLYQAVRTAPSSITCAKETTLLANIDIVLGALRGNPSLEFSDKIRGNRSVLLYMVGMTSEARVVYGGLPTELRSDPEVIISALGHKPFHSATASASVAGTPKLSLLMRDMPPNVAANATTMLEVVQKFPDIYTMLAMSVRKDPNVTLAAVRSTGLNLRDKLDIVRTIPLRVITRESPEAEQMVVSGIVNNMSNCMGGVSPDFYEHRSFQSVLTNRDVAVALVSMSNGFVMKQAECMVHYKEPIICNLGEAAPEVLLSSFDLARNFVQDVSKRSRGSLTLFSTAMWRYLFDITSVPFFRSVEFAKIGIDFYAHKYGMHNTKTEFLQAIKIDSASDGTLIGEMNLPDSLIEHIVMTGDRDLIRRLPYGKITHPRFGLMALNTGRFAICHFIDSHVSIDGVNATTVAKAWLQCPTVIRVVTETDRSVLKANRALLRHVSVRPVVYNYARIFELFPDAVKTDRNVALDIVKSWGRRAAPHELESLKTAMIKATKNTTTGWHIFRDQEVEQQMVIHTNSIVDDDESLTSVSTIVHRELWFDFGQSFVSDPIVLSLLSIAHLNRYVYSKSGGLIGYTVWLSSFEHDLVKYTTGDAEKRFKKAKAEKQTPAGYRNILDHDEWKDFASGSMTDDEYDALVAKQNQWADALVEIVAKSKRSNKRISDIATRIVEWLSRTTGSIATRLQRQEFDAIGDDLAGEGAETAEERRDRMRREIIEANDSDAEEEVGEPSAVGEKRGREDDENEGDEA